MPHNFDIDFDYFKIKGTLFAQNFTDFFMSITYNSRHFLLTEMFKRFLFFLSDWFRILLMVSDHVKASPRRL